MGPFRRGSATASTPARWSSNPHSRRPERVAEWRGRPAAFVIHFCPERRAIREERYGHEGQGRFERQEAGAAQPEGEASGEAGQEEGLQVADLTYHGSPHRYRIRGSRNAYATSTTRFRIVTAN